MNKKLTKILHKFFSTIKNIIFTHNMIFFHNILRFLIHKVIFHLILSYILIITAYILAKLKIRKCYLLKIKNIDACINKSIFLTNYLNKNVFGNGYINIKKNSPKLFEVLHTCYCRMQMSYLTVTNVKLHKSLNKHFDNKINNSCDKTLIIKFLI